MIGVYRCLSNGRIRCWVSETEFIDDLDAEVAFGAWLDFERS